MIPSHAFDNAHQRGYGICHDHRPNRRAKNNEQFRRLNEYQKFSMFHQVATGDGSQNDDDSDDRDHAVSLRDARQFTYRRLSREL